MTNFQSFLVVYTLLAWLLWPAYQGGMGVLYALLFPFHALLFTPAIVIDPPGTMVRKMLLDLSHRGKLGSVIYVRLRDTDRNVGFDWLTPSTDPDPIERRQANEIARDNFKKMLLFRRGLQDTSKNPIIDAGLNALLDLRLNQDCYSPEYWLTDAFTPGSPAQNFLLAHCTRPDIVEKFIDWNMLSVPRRRDETGPAQRIAEGYFGKTNVLVHTGATFDFSYWLNHGGSIFLDGDGMDDDAMHVMCMSILLRGFQHCRSGTKLPVAFVADEATKYTDFNIAQQMRELAKYWGFLHLLFQNPLDFQTPQIRNEVFGNTYHWWGHLGNPDAAEFAAKEIGTYLLDPNLVHHTETRYRQVHDGYDIKEIETTNVSKDEKGHERKGVNKGFQVFAKYRQEADELKHYTSYSDQVKNVQQKLLKLGKGEFFYRDEKVSETPVYYPLLREPWSSLPEVQKSRTAQAIAEIKARPMYRKFVYQEPPCNPQQRQNPVDDLAE